MKIWVTKYALTSGIEFIENARQVGQQTVLIRLKNFKNEVLINRRDWHLNAQRAVEKAEEMRAKKILNLKKQIEKLEKLEFHAVELNDDHRG